MEKTLKRRNSLLISKILSLILAFNFIACVPKRDSEVKSLDTDASARSLRLIAISGFNGALEKKQSSVDLPTGKNEVFSYGGAAIFASYLQFVRQQSGYPSLVVDSGDFLHGGFVTNSSEGLAMVDLYNQLGVEAAALGDREFMYGPIGDDSIVGKPGQNPTGALEKALVRAKFPVLAVNVVDKNSGRQPNWIKKSRLVTKQGIAVGIIGATLPYPESFSNQQNVSQLEFKSNVAELVIAEAQELRKLGAKLIVLTTHIGGACSNELSKYSRDVETGCKGEIFKLAEKLVGHVNAIAAGNAGSSINKVIQSEGAEILVLQSPSEAKKVAFADISVNGRISTYDFVPVCGAKILDKTIIVKGNREVVRGCDKEFLKIDASAGEEFVKVSQAMINGKTVQADKRVEQLLKPYFSEAKSLRERSAGATVTQEFQRSYREENPLGNLLADLMASHTGSKIAFSSNSRLHASLSAGEVKYNDIYEILPDDDQVVVVELSGRELKSLVARDVAKRTDAAFHWSGVLAAMENCELTKVLRISGNRAMPVEDDAVYRVATIEHMSRQLPQLISLSDYESKVVTRAGVLLRDMVFNALKGKVLDPKRFYARNSLRVSYRGTCAIN